MLAILPFQGFTETLAEPSGTEDLHRYTLRGFASKSVQVLTPMPWNIDAEGLCAYLRRNHFTKAIVVAYSWGAGYAAQKFARACRQMGIDIPVMCLCDPVYRPLWIPAWMGPSPFAIRAMIPGAAKIEIPASVRRVVWVRQRLDLPRGHDLVAASPRTIIEPPRVLPFSHTVIDEAPEWSNLVRSTITDTLRQLESDEAID